MRGALIGFGFIAMGHMAGYEQLDALQIVAAVDVSPERRAAAEAAGLHAYESFADLVANEDLDFVDVCTPPSTHGHYSSLGLAHDLHVLCEKPVFMPAEAGFKELVEDIWRSDRVFYPCHVYKFAPILEAVKEITRAPGFGDVLNASFRTLRRGHAVGVQEWRPHWRREREISGGGILRDHGPHSIYLAMDMTGRTPTAVSCLMGRLQENQYADTEDTALMRMRCDDGAEIDLTVSWGADHRSTTYTIAGASGFVSVDGDNLTYTIEGRTSRSVITSGFDDPSHKSWFVHMLRDFVRCVEEPGRQDAIMREALLTAFVMEAAYTSAERGGAWIDVEVPVTTRQPDRV
ncbi:Gfo/Idh/MocA family protein [Micromonospora eburnea]|uniref:Predicted dehydrogenase n=1 Tax=Micromonospora eburnea TaxID=227316 RepID=A0A1C6V187_9ACTN|nr:Gfo/Idh/MocA family oxidoreductase [Micromonospora eburnea]SCL60061.1 Predicted dehydrogenase [Micromonospora eburnea]